MFFLISALFLFALLEIFSHQFQFFSFIPHFFTYLFHFFTGQWGISYIFNQEVSNFIFLYALSSISLGSVALISSFFFGLNMAFYTLKYPVLGKWIQIILLGTPISIWAICLQFIFFGQDLPTPQPELHISQYILPLIIITLYHSASILQMNYQFFKEESSKTYYQLLINGKHKQSIFKKYLLRPHINSILNNLSLKICILLGGSIGIENFFKLPGMGFLVRKSILQQDYNLLYTTSFISLVFISLAYCVLDILKYYFEKRSHL